MYYRQAVTTYDSLVNVVLQMRKNNRENVKQLAEALWVIYTGTFRFVASTGASVNKWNPVISKN